MTLYHYLKEKSFEDNDLINAGLFKFDKNKILRDFFYKRLMFPIKNINKKVIGFGARSLDNSIPKYINSPESNIFKKGNILFNLDKAKEHARKKNNLLICEGYMDVISLYEKGIKSVVAPLGTAMTIEQLLLSWKSCKIPTLMFDGDIAGKKASIKSALLALKNLNPNYSINFLELPEEDDPDSYINNHSKNEFINFLMKPKNLSNFIFDHAKNSFEYTTPDQKIVFDKYFDDITNLIIDKKVKFFYKRDFKNKLFNFFKYINTKNNNYKDQELSKKINNLIDKELFSFIATYINHKSIRCDLVEELTRLKIDNKLIKKCFDEIVVPEKISINSSLFKNSINDGETIKIIEKSLSIEIYKLFPYSDQKYSSRQALFDVKNSLKIIESKLLNSIELDKSYKVYKSKSELLNWEELKNISYDIISKK